MNKILVDHPKSPFPLYRKKTRRFEITLTKRGDQLWACGECGSLHSAWGWKPCAEDDRHAKRRATDCCKQQYCQCGEKIQQGYAGPKCSPCNSVERSKKVIEKAVEIDQFDGPVFCDDADRYWSDLSEFEDWVSDQIADDERDSIPEWIFPCDLKDFKKLDATDLIQNYIGDEHHEDAADQIEGLDLLQAYLNEWCAKQTIQSWHPDYSRKISVQKILARVEK